MRRSKEALVTAAAMLLSVSHAGAADSQPQLTPEQQAELEKFRKKEAEAKRELKEVRKNLRKDIDSLENTLKWANIAGMPILVAAFGIVLAVVKNKRARAK